MQVLGDLVSTQLHTGARIPLLGYAPVITDTNGSAFETALHTGYRHIVLDPDNSGDLMVGTVIKLWFNDGKINRDDLFITLKVDIKAINRIRTKVTQRIHDLNCGYIDCLVMSKCEEISDLQHLQRAWQCFESMLSAGHACCLGICGAKTQMLEKLLATTSIQPAIFAADTDSSHSWRNLAVTELFSQTRKIPFLISLGWENTGKNLNLQDTAFKGMLAKYRKSHSQILSRYLIQRGLLVVNKSRDYKTIQESFQVLDFLLESKDMFSLSSILTSKH